MNAIDEQLAALRREAQQQTWAQILAEVVAARDQYDLEGGHTIADAGLCKALIKMDHPASTDLVRAWLQVKKVYA